MSWTTNPTAQREDMDAWLRGITDCLTQRQLNSQLKLSHQHVTHLQEELTRAQSRIDKLEVKVQDDLKTTGFLRELTHTQHCKDQLKASDEAEHETKTQVDKLQEALAVTERDKQELKTVQKHLENQLQSAEHQLEKAKADIESKNSKLTALEDHLQRCSVEIDHLTQQRDDANDELYANSSCQPQREIIQPDSKAATGMTFKDLNQLAKNITQFDPNSTEGHCIQAYLQDIDFLLESPWKPNKVVKRLPKPIITVFRQAYFGAHSKPESEEDLNFKTLFLRNLHPGLSRHLGIMACPVTNDASTATVKLQQPRPSLALEDTQWHDNATVLHQEHRECYSHANDSYHSNHVEKSWDPPEKETTGINECIQKHSMWSTTDKHPEVPENTILVTHHTTSSKLKNHLCAAATPVSTEVRLSVTTRRHHKWNATRRPRFALQLHASVPTTSQCLPENFLPYWTDPQQITEDPFQGKDVTSSSKLSHQAKGEQNRLRQI
ncbi:hypothetical protein F2P79_006099 [Pimephales promelas]|nr:hypothetical protein F2P79_006099 [Pimephales promelas]